MNQARNLPDACSATLDGIDRSDPRLPEQDAWRLFFAHLREEAPAHCQADSPLGPFWSITRFEDIVAIDSDHDAVSCEPTIITDLTAGLPVGEHFERVQRVAAHLTTRMLATPTNSSATGKIPGNLLPLAAAAMAAWATVWRKCSCAFCGRR